MSSHLNFGSSDGAVYGCPDVWLGLDDETGTTGFDRAEHDDERRVLHTRQVALVRAAELRSRPGRKGPWLREGRAA